MRAKGILTQSLLLAMSPHFFCLTFAENAVTFRRYLFLALFWPSHVMTIGQGARS